MHFFAEKANVWGTFDVRKSEAVGYEATRSGKVAQQTDAQSLSDQSSRSGGDSLKANGLTVGGLLVGNGREKSAEVIVRMELTIRKD